MGGDSTNPSEKYDVQIGSSPHGSKSKKKETAQLLFFADRAITPLLKQRSPKMVIVTASQDASWRSMVPGRSGTFDPVSTTYPLHRMLKVNPPQRKSIRKVSGFRLDGRIFLPSNAKQDMYWSDPVEIKKLWAKPVHQKAVDRWIRGDPWWSQSTSQPGAQLTNNKQKLLMAILLFVKQAIILSRIYIQTKWLPWPKASKLLVKELPVAVSQGSTASQNLLREPLFSARHSCHGRNTHRSLSVHIHHSAASASSFWPGGASFVVFRPAPSSIITKLEASKTFFGSFKVLVLATSVNSLADFFRVLERQSRNNHPIQQKQAWDLKNDHLLSESPEKIGLGTSHHLPGAPLLSFIVYVYHTESLRIPQRLMAGVSGAVVPISTKIEPERGHVLDCPKKSFSRTKGPFSSELSWFS